MKPVGDRGQTGAQGSVEPGSPTVQIYTFGDFRVVTRAGLLGIDAWRRRKALQLFKYLLSRPNHRVLKETAIELFWPDSDAEAASTNLRSSIHAIRRALEPAGAAD